MKMFKMNSRSAQRVVTTVALGLLLGAQTAMACTVGNWLGGSSGPGVLASGPDGPNGEPAIARYSGRCAMQTNDSSAEWVQDNSPGGINRIRARFYVLNGLDASQSAVVYRGFSTTGGTGNLFTVRLDTSGNVRLIDNATAEEVQQSSTTGWTSIEIDWSQGTGDGEISLSVNGQAPAAKTTLSNSGQALQSVRLGNLLGAGGTLNFDGYESRRTSEIGRLCEGDAIVDGERDFADINAMFVEFATGGSNPASGNPDITEDGLVDFADINEVFVLFATGQGACPNA